jgi:hypothetical protein
MNANKECEKIAHKTEMLKAYGVSFQTKDQGPVAMLIFFESDLLSKKRILIEEILLNSHRHGWICKKSQVFRPAKVGP